MSKKTRYNYCTMILEVWYFGTASLAHAHARPPPPPTHTHTHERAFIFLNFHECDTRVKLFAHFKTAVELLINSGIIVISKNCVRNRMLLNY